MNRVPRRHLGHDKGDEMRFAYICAGFVLALAGCSGGGGSDGPGVTGTSDCRALSGGGTSVQFISNCSGCSSQNNSAAIDGDLDSKATMTMGAASSGSVELRAAAQPGIVYPQGSAVGIVYDITGSQQAALQLSVVTYLNGAEQEVYPISTNGVGGGSGQSTKSLFTTHLMFDAIGFVVSRAASPSAGSFGTYEFCASN